MVNWFVYRVQTIFFFWWHPHPVIWLAQISSWQFFLFVLDHLILLNPHPIENQEFGVFSDFSSQHISFSQSYLTLHSDLFWWHPPPQSSPHCKMTCPDSLISTLSVCFGRPVKGAQLWLGSCWLQKLGARATSTMWGSSNLSWSSSSFWSSPTLNMPT